MSTLEKQLTTAVVAGFALFFGSVQVARAGAIEAPKGKNCRELPVIKNLTGLHAQHVCEGMTELTRPEVKKLARTAQTSEDHLTIARFYNAEANGFDAQAAGYESAAANLRNAPIAKNLAAPGTAGRFEFAASGFREKAKVDRELAATHEKMAAGVIALLE